MAVAGHSFGGFETNYIITHTGHFAAAISAAGISDLISSANSVWGSLGTAKEDYIINGPYKMGVPLFENPEIYQAHSPLLLAKNITTPLLIMHNVEDNSVPYVQGRSFFIQLRRLQKPVWMLSYEGENHLISNSVNNIDYHRRVKDFLGYYLKDEPIPGWMK
jgi:dipeptidyl aminopeptidase/acylaminoacyl peptidase